MTPPNPTQRFRLRCRILLDGQVIETSEIVDRSRLGDAITCALLNPGQMLVMGAYQINREGQPIAGLLEGETR